MPQDDIYLPVHVGREGKDALPYQPDNTGDNISAKNPSYCELTGLYWAWKNLDCDYLGTGTLPPSFFHEEQIFPQESYTDGVCTHRR